MTLTIGRKEYTTKSAAWFYADKISHSSGVHIRVHKEGVFWIAEPVNVWKYDVHTVRDL